MKHKLYKIFLLGMFLNMGIAANGNCQTPPVEPVPPNTEGLKIEVIVPPFSKFKWNDEDFKKKMNEVDIKLKAASDKIAKIDFTGIGLAMADFGKNFSEQFKDFSKSFEGIKDIDVSVITVPADYQSVEKSKIISKSYTVDGNDKLSINNQYGSVSISTWAKNEIKVDVEIKAFDSSDEEAQKMLSTVAIIDSKQPNLITFKTDIKTEGNQKWFTVRRNGKEERRGVQVNYVVYMPSKNPLNISNRYGSTTIPDFEGELAINSSYGSFTGKSLKNPLNKIKVSYGPAQIESLESTDLDISYGSLKLGTAGKLNADISYSSATIDKMAQDGNLTLKYGGLKINQLNESVKNLQVNAAYTSVALGFAPASSFNFDVTVSYSGFSFDKSKVNLISTEPSSDNSRGYNPTKNYKGTYGKSSGARVVIKSNYGGVKFL